MRLFAVLLVGMLSACAASPGPAPVPATSSTGIPALPTMGTVDYQLGGASELGDTVTVVARDRTDAPAPGVYSICYINGFQSQPQEADFWLDEHPDLLVRNGDGEPQIDENWPDEMALNTSTPESRTALAAIIGEWITGCRDDGYQAVEFDNLDSYSRFDGLTLDDNVAFATLLVASAHALGLAAGQKNSAELGDRGRDEIGFDFVVSEECFRYEECSVYAGVYGDQFIDIEYGLSDEQFGSLCDDPHIPTLTVVRDLGLAPEGDSARVYRACGA